MSDQLAIAALKEKRKKISAYITELYQKIGKQQRNLAYLDAAIMLLQPDSPNGVPAKKQYRRSNYFRRNELARIIADGLREASGPVTTATLAAKAMAAKDLPEQVLDAVTDMVLLALRPMMKRGEVKRTGTSRDTRWQAAAD